MPDSSKASITYLMEEIIACKHQRTSKLLSLCQDLYDIAVIGDDDYAKSFSLLYFSGAFLDLGQIKKCIYYGQQGYLLQKEHQYGDLLPMQGNILGCAFTDKGDFQSAMNYFYEGMHLAKSKEDYAIYSALLSNTATLYTLAGSYDRALSLLQKSNEFKNKTSRNIQNISAPSLFYYVKLLYIYLNQKDYENANATFQTCLSLSEEDQETWGEVAHQYYICEAQFLFESKGPDSAFLEPLLYAFSCLKKIGEGYDHISSFFSYLKGLNIFFTFLQHALNKLSQKEFTRLVHLYAQELSNFYRIAYQLNLPYRWLQYDKIKINFYEFLLVSMPDEILEKHYKMQLLSTYQHYYEQSIIRESEVKTEQLSRLTDLMALYNAQNQNTQNRNTAVRLKLESEQDALTGCANRFGLDNFMNTYFNYTKDSCKTFSCIIIDIDYFKQYNDTYGHVLGDACIKTISCSLREAQNDEGFLVRYGGDEFLLLYIGKTDSELLAIAKSIQQKIYEQNIIHTASIISDRITLTMGIVNSIPDADSSANDFLHAADNALYEVKKTSKNNYLLVHTLH